MVCGLSGFPDKRCWENMLLPGVARGLMVVVMESGFAARVLVWMCLPAVLCLPGYSASGAEAGKIDFNFQVRPLLSDRCW